MSLSTRGAETGVPESRERLEIHIDEPHRGGQGCFSGDVGCAFLRQFLALALADKGDSERTCREPGCGREMVVRGVHVVTRVCVSTCNANSSFSFRFVLGMDADAGRQVGCDACGKIESQERWLGQSCRLCNYDLCSSCAVSGACPGGHFRGALAPLPWGCLPQVQHMQNLQNLQHLQQLQYLQELARTEKVAPAPCLLPGPFLASGGSAAGRVHPGVCQGTERAGATPRALDLASAATAGVPKLEPDVGTEGGLAGAAAAFIKKWDIERRFLARLEPYLRSKADYRQELDRLDLHLQEAKAPSALRSGVLLVVFGDVDETTPMTGGSYAGEGGMSLLQSARLRQTHRRRRSRSRSRS